MSKLSLYPYQQKALESVTKSFNLNIHKQLLVMPTGSGKTILFIAITKHFNQKTLILAHRDELITQAYKKFKKFWPEANVNTYQGKNSSLDHQIIISSVQTCSQPNRLIQLKKESFSTLIVDECHHSISVSYQKVINELGFADNPEKLLLGVTATPDRSDKQSLSTIFQENTFSIGIDELIEQGFLSPVKGRQILTNIKLTGVKTTMGDFATGELSVVVNVPERNTFIVSKWKEHAASRKTLVFCVSVQHCKDLAAEFNKHGIKAAAVWGKMPRKDRKKILDDLRKGKISIVTSCSMLTEGFDEPSIACVVMARPTKSKSLYTQMVGRGLRKDTNPKTTKTDCLILDFTDKTHTLNTVVSLQQVMPNIPMIIEEETPQRKQSNSIVREQTIRSDKDVDKELNLFGKPKYIWIEIDGAHSLTDDIGNEVMIYQYETGYLATILLAQGIHQIVSTPMPLQECKDNCQLWAQKNLKITYADANSQWSRDNANAKPSSNQIGLLKRNNAYDPCLTKTEASTMIREIIARSQRDRKNIFEEKWRLPKTVYHNTKIKIPANNDSQQSSYKK